MMNKLAFIGAGSMTEAIIAGIASNKVVDSDQIYVTNKNNTERLMKLSEQFNVQCFSDKQKVIQDADMIILAMKPDDLEDAAETIKSLIKSNQLVISVVAGISTNYISKLLNKNTPIIRAMPNTSASIGYSATALAKGNDATNDHLLLSEKLFQAIGTTTVVDEDDMHIVTGISGSGPAFIYYLVEAMEKAAIDSGLDPVVAKSLLTQTVIGAGKMLEQTEETTAVLRENITSPAGTTEAGIQSLDRLNFHETVVTCVNSAKERSIELGKKS